MCRFLLVKSSKPLKPQELFEEFADMAETSRAPDGDRQGDGWGYASRTQNSKLRIQDSKWSVHKDLKPIWQCRDMFGTFPETTTFALHARSASFPQHKGEMDFNQPFTAGNLCFVFNGIIKGVTLHRNLDGTIGAQKIFSLIQQELQTKSPKETLRFVDTLLLENSKKIHGLNVGLVVDDNLFALCEYTDNNKYFGLRYYKDTDISLICSEPIGSYDWQTMDKGEVIQL